MMSEISIAYVYDGTLEGLLSAVFAAYANHEHPDDVVPESMLQPRLGQRMRNIDTNVNHAIRVRAGVLEAGGSQAFDAVAKASLSDDPGKGTIVYRFIRHIMSEHASEKRPPNARQKDPLSNRTNPNIGPLVNLARAVANERHRMMQFLRFEHLKGDVWFAKCNPNANVVPLLMGWFSDRFNTQAFIIYDESHNIAGTYDGRSWCLVKADRITLPDRASDEARMQRAWKRFYDVIAVESRYNPELRRQFMPKRLWENILETQKSPYRYTPVKSNGGMKLSSAAPPSCQK